MSEKTKRIQPNFSMDHSSMLSMSSVIREMFITDMADFTAFDPLLDAAFATEWGHQINNAYRTMNYRTSRAEAVIAYEEVQQKMHQCVVKCMEVKFFVQKAFPNDAAVQAAFGLPKINRARHYKSEMPLFIKLMYHQAEEYKTLLFAAGYTQPMIDELLNLSNELEGLISNHRFTKLSIKSTTFDRISLFNEIYSKTQHVNRASKIIYRNNPAKIHQYRTSPTKKAAGHQD